MRSPLSHARRGLNAIARLPLSAKAGISAALLITVAVVIALLGWPPALHTAWRWGNLVVIALVAASWLMMIATAAALPQPVPIEERQARPVPRSYKAIARARFMPIVRRALLMLLGVSGAVMIVSIGIDLVWAAFGRWLPMLPWTSFTAHSLYALVLLLTEPFIVLFVIGAVVFVTVVDLGYRYSPASFSDARQFELLSVTDKKLSSYRNELDRLGRRLIVDDLEQTQVQMDQHK